MEAVQLREGRGAERWEPHAAWAGVAFVALFLGGLIVAGDPGTESGSKIATHFSDHRTAVLIGMYLAGLGLVALSVWAWSVRASLSRAGEERLATTVLVAAAIMIAVEFPVIALDTGLAFISNQTVDPGVARAIHDLAQVFSDVDWFPAALMFAALCGAFLRTRLVPRWLAWSAALVAVLSLIAAAPTFELDVPVSLLAFVWIIAVSVTLGITALRTPAS